MGSKGGKETEEKKKDLKHQKNRKEGVITMVREEGGECCPSRTSRGERKKEKFVGWVLGGKTRQGGQNCKLMVNCWGSWG